MLECFMLYLQYILKYVLLEHIVYLHK